VIEVGNETANGWAFDKMKQLEIIQFKSTNTGAGEHTKSQVATIASKCS